ncbi:hypothetical protein BBO99_00004299 [Phytophthora kernoviae]|uniref:Amino acid transporter transmembrane domain-containing protein n=2 Tax=Phytophthora kernoviae TaxID=325452 RepID=A0A421GRP6_9STRA|nr:hypothetical protein BBI17_004437 [Phytophthora kernoviae]RLN80706.1 hypothetical protein BBO99_00004299 [Phytophthora kernoviae]
MGTSGKPFLTFEDLKMAFNVFCCVYGVGTLGMPGNFSRAGPVLAVIAMAFMAFANVYASVAICRVMLLAPKSVKTYGDLGQWCMGKWGHWLAVVSQMASCLLVPCVFLVLGGSLLDGLFPDAFSDSVWIIFMALMCLPVCLIPTLKEGAGAAFAGCMGTVIADVIGVAVVMYGMRGHPSVPAPDLKFSQVAGVFGNLSLAYGNLLFSIYPDATSGLTTLGFASDWGAVVLAYLFMQLHITIAFSVLLNPVFYLSERLALGMHKKKQSDIEDGLTYADMDTPAKASVVNESVNQSERPSRMSYVSVADAENPHYGDAEAEAAEYRGANAIKYVLMRIAIIVVLVVLSIVLKDHFSDLSDFVGASCISLNSIILPIVFLLKKCWGSLPMYEKIPAVVVVVVCCFLGCYVTYTSGKTLFSPTDSDVSFPYCDPEYETTVYYNYTAVHGL